MSEYIYTKTVRDNVIVKKVIVSGVTTNFPKSDPIPNVEIGLCRMPSEKGDHELSRGSRGTYIVSYSRELTEDEIQKIVNIIGDLE